MIKAMDFYTQYARHVGFDVRRQGGKQVKGIYLHRYMVCNREGLKSANDKCEAYSNDLEEKKRRRTSNRCLCPAQIKFRYVANIGYVVTKFVEEHNHELVQDKFKVFLKVNRKMDHIHQSFITDCAKANIGASHAHKLLCEILGGQEFVGCTVTEAINFTSDMKAFVNGVDAQMLLNQMKHRKESNESFIYHFEVDADDNLNRLFWCDSICRSNYHMYGDVVTFDTAYSTNKYCMIFAPFTGKDNHGKPVTFAAGLLSKEDSDSFTWLFDKFIKCMGIHPKMIITDQDLGMRLAIQNVLPATRHRWCMWHIMLKVADKVPRELQSDSEFKKHLNECVWSELIEPCQFEDKWNGIMDKYGLSDVTWFKKMFEDREFWVPAYFRDFAMGSIIRTTSISECENNFYKNYTRSRYNLLEFMMSFDSALDSQRHQRLKLDYLDNTQMPTMETKLVIEKHAASIYTAAMFKEVQKEIAGACFNCKLVNMSVENVRESYKILDIKDNNADVHYDILKDEYSCSCKLVGRTGYLCSHIFFVLKNKGVESIPSKYVNPRWVKSSMYKSVFDVPMEDNKIYKVLDDHRRLKNQIMTVFYGWLHKIDHDEGMMSSFLSGLNDLGRVVTGTDSSEGLNSKDNVFKEFYGDCYPTNIEVHPPKVVKTKGSGSRLVSRKEKAIKDKLKPMRMCAKCKQLARHDSRNCPMSK